MKPREKAHLAAIVLLFLAPHLIVWHMDVQAAEKAAAERAAAIAQTVSCAAPAPEKGTGPAPRADSAPEADEGEKIEAALLERGYFRKDVPLSFDLQDHAQTACEAFGVPYPLLLGLIETESQFDPEAVSPKGCYGLCQLNPRYFPAGLEPWENIWAGAEYLGGLLVQYDSAEAALTAYNAGYDTGSRVYAGKVLAAAEKWTEIFA